jgi:multidrug resistance efflux pump
MRRIWPYATAVLIFLVYIAWISGPYLRSILVRDAAITTWSNLATAPIRGTITFEPIAIGGKISPNGLLATVTNNHVSQAHIDEVSLRVSLGEARLEHARDLLAEIETLEDDRRATKSRYADVFRKQLDTKLDNVLSEITINKQRLEIIKSIVERKEQLADRGAAAFAAVDEEKLRMVDIELAIKNLQSDLFYTQQRRASADHGTFIDEYGDDPGWVRGYRLELKLEKKKARHEPRTAEIELANAVAELERAKIDFERSTTSEIKAPPGHILWRKRAVTGMTVAEGTPVAEWIDCKALFVDMPVSDAEASLISQGDRAEVILEGESSVRPSEVVLVRGSAATLGREELVALAKGRQPGEAQVVLKLEATPEEFDTCPVGSGAYVDLIGVGLLDVLKARLRL